MRDRISRVTVYIGLTLFILIWFADPHYSDDETVQLLIKSAIIRLLGGVIFTALLINLRYRVFHRPPRRAWTVWFPCLLVVVNNLPILALLTGAARVDRTALIWLFATDSLLIGLFEEAAFRGTLFLAALERHRNTKRQIVWVTVLSSALFGLVHLFNLLEGAGPGPTILQVGYSFLIGGMCAIVLLKTQNLIICILLHAIYDFCGGLLPTLGSGSWWDIPTVIFTVILALAVCAWMLWVLWHISPAEVNRLYYDEKKEHTSNE